MGSSTFRRVAATELQGVRSRVESEFVDWKIFAAIAIGGTLGILGRRSRVTPETSDDELRRIRAAGLSTKRRVTKPTKVPAWVYSPRDVPDPLIARWSAIAGLVALALATAGFFVGYSDHRAPAIDFLHGLTIFAVPVLALVAVVSRARAKEAIAQEIRDERIAFSELVRRRRKEGDVKRLLRLLDDPKAREEADRRAEVLAALLVAGKRSVFAEPVVDPRTIPVLSRLAHDPDGAVRRNAVFALRSTGDPAATPALMAALEDENEAVRYHAVLGLGDLKERGAVLQLGQLLGNRYEGRAAARALISIRDARGVAPLEAAAHNARSPLRRRFFGRAAGQLRNATGL